MNARLDAIPLATARLEREKVELAIERSKLEARKAAVVRVADAVGDGLALRRLLAERFAALEAELCADLAPGEDEWRAHAILTDAVQRFLHGVADAVATGGASRCTRAGSALDFSAGAAVGNARARTSTCIGEAAVSLPASCAAALSGIRHSAPSNTSRCSARERQRAANKGR